MTATQAQDYYYPPLFGNYWETTSPESLGWCSEAIDSLHTFLDTNGTKAFIILKDGKIVMEEYYNGQTQSTFWQWNSAGKTITSFLVGKAQEEGFLSIEDATSQHLGQGWTSCDSTEESLIKIKHHLSMTTAMNDLIFNCNTPNCLICIDTPGNRWSYHNGPYRLLTDIVANATGETYNDYTTQKLKSKIGMNGFWVQTESNDIYLSNARSMARFGSLILNDCIWNGDTIMTDSIYKKAMTQPSQSINQSYGYLWWLNGYSTHMVPASQQVYEGPLDQYAPSDLVMAAGKDGQYCDVIPSENMIVIRMGDAAPGDFVAVQFHREIWSHLSPIIFGQDTLIWQGQIDQNWHEPGNWDKNCLPGKHTHVILSENNLPVYVASDVEIKSLYLENDEVLFIEPDVTFKVGNN